VIQSQRDEQMMLCHSPKPDPTKIVFIVSPPYSGSTLLTLLLATHPAIGTLGERKNFYRKVIRPADVGSPYCTCGARFEDCEFWSAVKSEVLANVPSSILSLTFTDFQLYHNSILNKLAHKICLTLALKGAVELLPWPLSKRFGEVCNANAVLIDAILRVDNASVYLDSSKQIRHALYLDSIRRFKVYAIHLLRDGRAQVCSTLKHHQGRSVELASQLWAGAIRFQTGILENCGCESLVVKYECLCADPGQTAAEIYGFCGLDATRGSLRFRDFEQHIMGNIMRLGSSQQIHNREEWRRKLSSDQLEVFDRLAGDLNRQLGYGE
jgi:LPS sulfotransferase NodH